MISIDEFKKIDIRVAKVLSAERIPQTDRLIVLQVDLGTETRQIVHGLGTFYEPEDFVGRRIIVVANLEPTKIRGVESNGMLLAAENSEKRAVFLTTESPIDSGSKVR